MNKSGANGINLENFFFFYDFMFESIIMNWMKKKDPFKTRDYENLTLNVILHALWWSAS